MRRGAAGRSAATVLAAVAAAALLALSGAPAHAAGYRYWSFWEQRDGSWAYATQGPSVLRPSDGDVLGFRFSVSENSGDAAKPRGPAEFATVCADTAAESGSARVALVLDFGTAADAPRGERPPRARTACARIEEGATAADALADAAKPLRYNSDALLCAIEGYPEAGCGEQVTGGNERGDKDRGGQNGDRNGDRAPARDDASGDGGDGPPAVLGVAAGAGAVLVLAAAALWQSRRRRG